MLGPLEQYTTPTLNTVLLNSSRASADLGRTSDISVSEINTPYLDGIRTYQSRVTPLMKCALYLQATTAGLLIRLTRKHISQCITVGIRDI